MAKKNKNVVEEQQKDVTETIEDVISDVEPTTDEVVEQELQDDEGEVITDEDIKEALSDETPNEELSVEEPLNIGAPTEIPVEIVKPKRSIGSLSKDEYRTYLRTGRIPE